MEPVLRIGNRDSWWKLMTSQGWFEILTLASCIANIDVSLAVLLFLGFAFFMRQCKLHRRSEDGSAVLRSQLCEMRRLKLRV